MNVNAACNIYLHRALRFNSLSLLFGWSWQGVYFHHWVYVYSLYSTICIITYKTKASSNIRSNRRKYINAWNIKPKCMAQDKRKMWKPTEKWMEMSGGANEYREWEEEEEKGKKNRTQPTLWIQKVLKTTACPCKCY